MPRGGFRVGSGRKPKIVKVLDEALVEKIFRMIGVESARWANLYQRVVASGDTATEFKIIQELTNRKYGKPKERVEMQAEVRAQLTIDEADEILRQHSIQVNVLAVQPAVESQKNVLETFDAREKERMAKFTEFARLAPAPIEESAASVPKPAETPTVPPSQEPDFINELCGPGSTKPSGKTYGPGGFMQ